jgi:hypothetical protein
MEKGEEKVWDEKLRDKPHYLIMPLGRCRLAREAKRKHGDTGKVRKDALSNEKGVSEYFVSRISVR